MDHSEGSNNLMSRWATSLFRSSPLQSVRCVHSDGGWERNIFGLPDTGHRHRYIYKKMALRDCGPQDRNPPPTRRGGYPVGLPLMAPEVMCISPITIALPHIPRTHPAPHCSMSQACI